MEPLLLNYPRAIVCAITMIFLQSELGRSHQPRLGYRTHNTQPTHTDCSNSAQQPKPKKMILFWSKQHPYSGAKSSHTAAIKKFYPFLIIIRETQNVFQRVESFVKFHFAHFVSNIFINLFQLLTLHYIEWSVEYISAFQHNWQMCITSIISILLFAMTHPCDRDSGNDFSFPFRFRFLKYPPL